MDKKSKNATAGGDSTNRTPPDRGSQDYFGSVDFGPRANIYHNAFTLLFQLAMLCTALLDFDATICTFISTAPLTVIYFAALFSWMRDC